MFKILVSDKLGQDGIDLLQKHTDVDYDIKTNLSHDELIKRIDKPCIITGEISSELRNMVKEIDQITTAPPTTAMRSPKYLAELAWKRWQVDDHDDVLTLSPYYLHKGEPIPG